MEEKDVDDYFSCMQKDQKAFESATWHYSIHLLDVEGKEEKLCLIFLSFCWVTKGVWRKQKNLDRKKITQAPRSRTAYQTIFIFAYPSAREHWQKIVNRNSGTERCETFTRIKTSDCGRMNTAIGSPSYPDELVRWFVFSRRLSVRGQPSAFANILTQQTVGSQFLDYF